MTAAPDSEELTTLSMGLEEGGAGFPEWQSPGAPVQGHSALGHLGNQGRMTEHNTTCESLLEPCLILEPKTRESEELLLPGAA
jgi:hypothetical protein